MKLVIVIILAVQLAVILYFVISMNYKLRELLHKMKNKPPATYEINKEIQRMRKVFNEWLDKEKQRTK